MGQMDAVFLAYMDPSFQKHELLNLQTLNSLLMKVLKKKKAAHK